MNEGPDWRFVFTASILTAFVGWFQHVSLPVLDEESYLAIAEQLRFARPYDWSFSWLPHGDRDAYVYAHPPLFLWWVKVWLGLLGEGILAWKWLMSIPFQLLLGGSVAWFASKTEKPWLAFFLWLSLPIVSMTASRGLMPDLQVTALGTAAMAFWFSAEGDRASWKHLVAGVLLAMASWTKYPALLLVVVPLVYSRSLRSVLPMMLSFSVCWIVGEGWLWWEYGRWHLWEVLVRAPEIPRGSVEGRLMGILLRLSIGAPVLMVFEGGC